MFLNEVIDMGIKKFFRLKQIKDSVYDKPELIEEIEKEARPEAKKLLKAGMKKEDIERLWED